MTSSTRSAARSPATAAISSTSTPPHSWDSVVKKLFDGKVAGVYGVGDGYASNPMRRAIRTAR